MADQVHTFAGNPLDRGEALRRDEATIARLQRDQRAVFLPFRKLHVGVCTDASGAQTLNWLSAQQLESFSCEQVVFLGVHNQQPHFAAALTASPANSSANSPPNSPANSPKEDGEFVDCRLLASQLAVTDTGIVAQARAQLDWHQRNPFCAQCGHTTRPGRGGQIRHCDHCDKHTFPRTDPVAIMLIVDEPGGDRCLLGKSQGRMAASNFYSALAGFLDQGESLEEAVRREVWEEAGIRVGDVQYHSSQPWPFPSQLMIGCHGVADSLDIHIDEVEMADVSWFSKADVAAALAGDNPDLRVPGALAIAHHLIRAWVAGEVVL